MFEEIILKYVKQFPDIPNELDVKPTFEIHFIHTSDTIKFWISGHIGEPSLIPPLEPGTQPPLNPLEQKGIIKINKQPYVIYDFKNSDGYNLYNPNSVNKNKIKKIKKLPYGYTAGMIIPESWLVAIFSGNIKIIDKREPYKIQL
ncbi:MAG: hypothetical protein ABR595_10870 [Psychroflexus sp.]